MFWQFNQANVTATICADNFERPLLSANQILSWPKSFLGVLWGTIAERHRTTSFNRISFLCGFPLKMYYILCIGHKNIGTI